jgi:hypothetical protein
LYLKKVLTKDIADLIEEDMRKNLAANPDYLLALKKAKTTRKHDVDVHSPCRIMDITFAYDNHALIALLKKRGAAITALNHAVVHACDAAIPDLIRKGYEKLTRPVVAFITFESDDAYNEACSFSPASWK